MKLTDIRQARIPSEDTTAFSPKSAAQSGTRPVSQKVDLLTREEAIEASTSTISEHLGVAGKAPKTMPLRNISLQPHSQPLSLSEATLKSLDIQQVEVPRYNRGEIQEGIVHFGVGNFHRSHLAVFVHQLMDKEDASNWGICGVGLTPNAASKRDKLMAQDGLFTVVERSQDGDKPRIVGSMTSYLTAPTQSEQLIAKLAAQSTHIVSMTLTGDGYFYDEHTKQLKTSHVDIAHDLANQNGTPRTVYGYLAAGLARRKQNGMRPFTVMSCDNLPANGDRTRDMLLSFTQKTDPALSAWLKANGAFPNSMVDRIAPESKPSDQTLVLQKFGFVDLMPVMTEPFLQLVMEDKFSDGRPNLERVGVQFVTDVEPFGRMKQRMLNASHSDLAYLGHLGGFKYVNEVIGNQTFKHFIGTMMKNEAGSLGSVEGTDLQAYQETLLKRFANPSIRDEVLRLCRNGSGKIPKFILPSIRDRLAIGGDTKLLTLTVAAWIRFLTGKDDAGLEYEIKDPHAEKLQSLALKNGSDAEAFMQQSGVFDVQLLEYPQFIGEVQAALASLHSKGAVATLEQYVGKG